MAVSSGQVYFGYSNLDAIFALKISSDLLCAGYPISIDRLRFDPTSDWAAWQRSAVEECNFAVLIISDNYLAADYCQHELQILKNRKIPVIPLLIGGPDAATTRKQIGAKATASIDLRDWRTLDSYGKGFRQIKALFEKLGIVPAPITAETQYLIRLMADMELRLLQTTSGAAACGNAGIPLEDVIIRPRAYHPDVWLNSGEYLLQEQGASERSELVVENILQWLALRPQIALIGDEGSGKTTLLYHLVLVAVRARLRDPINPLPLFAELIDWREKTDFINQFLAERVPFIKRVRDSLISGAVMLYLDGLNEIVGLRDHRFNWLRDWLDKDSIPGIVITCRSETYYREITLPLPVMQMGKMTDEQIRLLLADVLPAETAQSLTTDLLASQVPPTPDFVALAALQQHVYPDATLELSRGYLLGRALPALWDSADKSMLGRFSFRQIADALQQFAYLLFEQGAPVYVPRQTALEVMQDDLLIQTAIYLGILDSRDGKIRFRQYAMQTYFAAEALISDGIYSRLVYPQFDGQDQRIATIWDDVIGLVPQILSQGANISAIEAIAEVDPYLAFDCIMQQDTMPHWLYEEILWKLLDMRRHPQRSMRATARVFETLERADISAAVLLKALRAEDWSTSQTAFSFLLKLPLVIPPDLIDALTGLDRNFPDTVFEAIEGYDMRVLLPALMKLTTHHRTIVRRNTIWALGELADPAAVPALASISLDESPEILQETAQAIGKLGDHRAESWLFQLAVGIDRTVTAKALDALERLGRRLTAALLRLLADDPGALSRTLVQEIARSNEQIVALALCSEFEPDDTLRPAVEEALRTREVADNVKRLMDFISDRMQSLRDRNAFEDLTKDIENVLGVGEAASKERSPHLRAIEARIRGGNTPAEEPETEVTAQAAPVQAAADTHLPAKLEAALEHKEWLIRQRGVRQLKRVPPRLALPWLLKSLKDSDVQVRVAAIEALPDPAQYPVVIEALLKALDDTEYHVIDAATDRLKIHGNRFVPKLLQKLNTDRPITLAAVIELLGELGDASVTARLIPFLKDERTPWMGGKSIGDYTAQALIAIGASDGLEAVRDAGFISWDNSADIIPPDIDISSGTGDPQIAALLETLRGDVWDASQKAAKDLRDYARKLQGNTIAARQLAAALTDENWVVRWTAAEALAWIKDTSITPELVALLKDPNWIVQVAAIRALVEIEAKDSVSEIISLLQVENNGIREAAAEAIGLLGTPDDLPSLKKNLKDPDKFVRLAVVKAISEIPCEDSTRMLIKALEDEYSHIRWQAIRRLADLEDPRLIRYFVERLNDTAGPEWEDKPISDIALEGLQRIGTPESERVLEKLRQIQQDKSRKRR